MVYQDDDLLVCQQTLRSGRSPAAGHEAVTLVNILVHHVPNLSMGLF